jgi:arabinogalactan oligomer/maltooligosaccharide transport system permease protein
MAHGSKIKKKQNLATVLSALGDDLKKIGLTFKEGDIKTKLSFIIFGLGPLLRGQILIGLTFMVLEALFFWYMTGFGWMYLSKITTL